LATFGAIAWVDDSAPHFGGLHRLSTAFDPAVNLLVIDLAHSAPVVDASTPRNRGGTPRYRPVCVHMLFPD
jgi:hypothetical protein